MNRFYSLDLLIVAVGAGVKIGPGNRDRVRIIPHFWSRWIHIPGVKMISRSNPSEVADGAPQIHVIPRDERAPTSGAKRIYPAAVLGKQAVPDIDREEPQLIIVAAIKIREKRIGRPERIAVPRRHVKKRLPRLVPFLAEERREKREPGDRPIIRRGRYCCLQQDFDGHGIL